MDALRAADALANIAPVVQVITEWRHTAEVHADPELAALIRQSDDDYGVVPVNRPGFSHQLKSKLAW